MHIRCTLVLAACLAAGACGRDSASGDGEFGIAVCDEFLRRYAACIAKAPGDAQGAMQAELDTWRGTWTPMRADPMMRDVLTQHCAEAADEVDSELKSYRC